MANESMAHGAMYGIQVREKERRVTFTAEKY